MTLISGVFAVFLYALGSLFQGLSITQETAPQISRNRVFMLAALAVVAHAISAFGVIRTNTGYHFGLVEISTLITVSISLLVLISSLRKPLENLFVALFPLAIVTILMSLTISSSAAPTQMGLELATHIIFSILAYSFFTIAALQALFVAYQNRQLKNRHANGLIRRFPPLQDMESFLFELLWVGEILLTVGMLIGTLFVSDFWEQEGIAHKAILSAIAWVIFAVLLWGRKALGWRGTTAIRWTLAGFGVLILGFYGVKIALEYIIA